MEDSGLVADALNKETPTFATVEQLAGWLYDDCEINVYSPTDLAAEILRYFAVRPLEGVSLPTPPAQELPPAPDFEAAAKAVWIECFDGTEARWAEMMDIENNDEERPWAYGMCWEAARVILTLDWEGPAS
jgi:hypothetical protein